MQQLTAFEVHKHGQELKLMMSELPYGDPFSGTPYGQYHKSKGLGMILGVVASVVTMGAALPMLGSSLLATQIAGGVMMTGGVLSGVGAITGNKKLAMIGGVLSLAGAVGGFASNATGGFGMGSSNVSVQNFAGNMMETINSTGINVFNPDVVSAAKGVTEAAALPEAAGVGNVGDTALEGGSATQVTDSAVQVPDSGTNINLQGNTTSGATPKLNLQTDGVLPPEGGEIQLSDPNFYGDRANTGILNKGVSGPVGDAVTNPLPDQTISPDALEAMRTGGTPPPKETGLASWLKDNKEVLKLGAGFVSDFAKSGMAPDQQSYIDSLAAKYAAEVDVLKNQSDLQKYQLANAGKQVAMISAGDPDLDAKVKAAKAAGHAVAFIPNIAAGGVTRNPNTPTAYGASVRTAAQSPIRQATNSGVA